MLIGYRFYNSVAVITTAKQKDKDGNKVERNYINLSTETKDVPANGEWEFVALNWFNNGKMVREIHEDYGIRTVKEL